MINLTKLSMLLSVVFTFSVLSGCSSKPTTRIDFNPETNFSSFSSFQFTPAKPATLDSNPIMTNRIQVAVEHALIKHGLVKIDDLTEQNADLTIKVNFNQQEKENNSSLSIGFGTGRMSSNGGGSLGVSTNVPIESDATLITKIIVDMSHQDVAVWHGTDRYEAKGDITSEELNSLVSTTVNRMLANFPPQKQQQSK